MLITLILPLFLAYSPSPRTAAQVVSAELFERARAGDPDAEYQVGRAYQTGSGVDKDNHEALRWFRLAADRGNPNAQNALGTALLYGYGEQRDIKQALVLLTKAGSNGNIRAQYTLGDLYESGGIYTSTNQNDFVDLVPKNFTLAAGWYRRAADQGESLSQNHLGCMYLTGEGVPQNYAEAYFWLSVGNAGGRHSTTNGTDDGELAASHLTKAQLASIQQRASKWFEAHPAIDLTKLEP